MTYYMPYHCVTNSIKQSKFRAVFDSSAKFVGTSLNDYLLKGLDLLNSLVAILLRFRNEKYSVPANFKKVFHQIFAKKIRETT